MDGRTNGHTDRRTDIPSYRDARKKEEKKWEQKKEKRKIKERKLSELLYITMPHKKKLDVKEHD